MYLIKTFCLIFHCKQKNKQKKTAVYFETIFSMVELKTVGKFV